MYYSNILLVLFLQLQLISLNILIYIIEFVQHHLHKKSKAFKYTLRKIDLQVSISYMKILITLILNSYLM